MTTSQQQQQQLCANCSTNCIITIENDDDPLGPIHNAKKRKVSSSAVREILLHSTPTTIKVQNALTEIYNLKVTTELDLDGLEELKSSSPTIKENDDIILCRVCGEKLQNLYTLYKEFNQLRKQDSYLTHKIGQLDFIINRLKESWSQILITTSETRCNESNDEINSQLIKCETILEEEDPKVDNFDDVDNDDHVHDNYLEVKVEVPVDFQFEGEDVDDDYSAVVTDDPLTMVIYPSSNLTLNEQQQQQQTEHNTLEESSFDDDIILLDDDDEHDQIGTTVSSITLTKKSESGQPSVTNRSRGEGAAAASSSTNLQSQHTAANPSLLKCLAPLCSKQFVSQRQLRRHVCECQYLKKVNLPKEKPKCIQPFQVTVNGSRPNNTCPLCPEGKLKLFNSIDDLMDHWITSHTRPGSLECPVCRVESATQSGRRRHLRMHVSRISPVKVAKPPVSRRSQRNRHQISNPNYVAQTYKKCPLCPGSQSYSNPMIELCNHWMIEHHIDGDNSCPLCKRSLSSFESLRYHLRAHVGDRRVSSTLDL